MRIAFISYQVQEKYGAGVYHDEESVLLEFLKNKGLNIERAVWNDPLIEWSNFDVAILKSPWDYHENFADFNAWLDRIEALGIRLLNPYGTIRWNSDKHYLKEIADAGLAVIPSSFLEKGTTPELSPYFDQLDAEKLILKPCVSAGAKNTLILLKEDINTRKEEIYALLKEESYIIQPFMEEIKAGEWSFLFFNGAYSHSLLKLPKNDDFRVQHYHGGSIRKEEPPMRYVEQAGVYVHQFAKDTLYARVDGVIVDDRLVLMELELIEPYLFLEIKEDAIENYYKALLGQLEMG